MNTLANEDDQICAFLADCIVKEGYSIQHKPLTKGQMIPK